MQEKERAPGTQVDLQAGIGFELMDEVRVHLRAGGGERLQRGGDFQGEVGEHAAGGPGGFVAGFAFVDDEDCGARFAQFDGQGKADDSGADDDYVPGFHDLYLSGWLRLAKHRNRN